jgi:2-polyprenyl-3-methyl-5-hydroxy-6-metoxy-1,4-benzoquinol methylase
MFPLTFLAKRSVEEEFMDSPDAEAHDFRKSFRFIRFVNQCGGGSRAAIKALSLTLSSWPREKPVHILDVGCGRGDMGPDIVRWGKKKGYDIRYRGIDFNQNFISLAKKKINDENIEFMTGNIFDPNLPEADIIIASMVFHHFGNEELTKAFHHLLEKSRHAFIINDLTRTLFSYLICFLLTRFVKDEVCRNDVLVSVKKGFRLEEVRSFIESLKIRGIVKKQFGCRFILIIPKKEQKTV